MSQLGGMMGIVVIGGPVLLGIALAYAILNSGGRSSSYGVKVALGVLFVISLMVLSWYLLRATPGVS